jgi:enterochelin esterase-like enzyme
MHTNICRLLILAILTLLLPRASAESPGSKLSRSRRQLEHEYAVIARALTSKDVATLVKARYGGLQPDGSPPPSQEIEAWWKANFAEVKAYGPVTFHIEKFAQDGDTATLTVRRVLFYSVEGAEEQLEDSRSRDVWQREEGTWRFVRREVMEGTTTGEIKADAKAPESPRIAELATQIQSGSRKAVTRFWQSVQGKSPLIEALPGDNRYVLVTFLWRADRNTQNVQMRGGLPSERPKPFSRLSRTDVWYWTERLPKDARFAYSLWVTQKIHRPGRASQPAQQVIAVTYPPDPLNPHMFNDGPILELPEAPPQPWRIRKPEVPAGEVKSHVLQSDVLKEKRTVTVYTPPGYAPGRKDTRLLIFFDGEDYQRLIPTPVILDNLIASKRIPPAIAVLVHNQGTRFRDLRCSDAFAEFVVKELLPWTRGKYAVSADPQHVVVAGLSLGGLMAGYCALRYPDVIGNVLSQSGAFWFSPSGGGNPMPEDGWIATQFAVAPPRPIRFYMEVGRLESTGMIQNNRRLRDVLRARGYAVTYSEFNGGHDYLTWRGSLAEGLIVILNPPEGK